MIPAALGDGDGDDRKAAVEHPKTTATTVPKKSSVPPSKPKVTPPADFLPKFNPAVGKNIEDPRPKPKVTSPPAPLSQNDPAVENNAEDLPPKPKMIPPPPEAKKPVPVLPITISKLLDVVTPVTSASGRGGCRMLRHFGKRMLVC